MRKKLVFLFISFILTLSITPDLYSKTPVEFLKEAKKPNFKEGHTLPPLTRWGWCLGEDTIIELAKNWGYALELSESNNVTNEKSQDYRIAGLSKKEGLPISVKVPRPIFGLGKTFLKDIADEKAFMRDAEGNVIKVLSPEADDIVYERVAEVCIDILNKVAELSGKENIKVILNGGEYGVSVYGWHKKYWEKDIKGDTY